MIRSHIFFFFKQKTAYEMRISDWSSDVCSSDLPAVVPADASVAVDDEGLGHAGDAPLDGGTAGIGADAPVGIAELGQPGGGVLRLVAVIDPVERHAGLLGQRAEEGMLSAAGQAPGSKEVHHDHAAARQIRGCEEIGRANV